VYNVALGTYLKHVEHKVYRGIQRVFKSDTPVVFKGLNTFEMGAALHRKWSRFKNPVAVSLDATKFDMHVSVAMLRWEHSIYSHMFRGDAELEKLLSWQLVNLGKGYAWNGSLSYKVHGRRFSGDMNTALGNCLIMCGMIHSWIGGKFDYELANNGDDAVVIMEKRYLQSFNENLCDWFLTLGFRMVVEDPVTVLEEIEFCQMHPIYDGEQWRMVRNFNSAREKDSMCLLKINGEVEWRKWLGAIGECGLALTNGIPVVQSFYSAYMRSGLKSNMNNALIMQTGFLMMSRGLTPCTKPVTNEARLSFFLAFGVTPDEQVALEQYYDGLSIQCGAIETIENLQDIYSSPF